MLYISITKYKNKYIKIFKNMLFEFAVNDLWLYVEMLSAVSFCSFQLNIEETK